MWSLKGWWPHSGKEAQRTTTFSGGRCRQLGCRCHSETQVYSLSVSETGVVGKSVVVAIMLFIVSSFYCEVANTAYTQHVQIMNKR